MSTKKIYYDNSFLTECSANILEINDNGIILDQTVAFPEGGGQIGDTGTITNLSSNISAEFTDTKKIEGKALSLKDFPPINIECKIVHYLEADDLTLFKIGDKVNIKIDINRRAKTTLHHSGLHIALMVFNNLRKDILKSIIGCKITDEYGHVDIKTENMISPEELNYIAHESEELFSKNIPIQQISHKMEKEAFYWKCLNYRIPCGGTHATNTGDLKGITVKRKHIGKGADRLIITLNMNENFIKKYI